MSHWFLMHYDIVSVTGLSCYACHSAEPGCGKELNIRLERWHSCPSVTAGGGENFCVKLIEKRGSKDKSFSFLLKEQDKKK